ncbi:MAG: zeta toxin family protein [Candidatus Saccharibacteria bacterium]|nr:zeta toxin family protein [Candidatus Saccharibacteria bacterium]
MEENLQAVISYMKSHWPSDIKDEWQVKLEEYPEILKKVLAKWTVNSSRTNELVRIAGQSGSGKTTQLLPAVEAYFKNNSKNPILVAARRFVEFHPNMEEIKNEYGEENLRKKTDEFSTIMMFLTLNSLTSQGYDIILDVTLLDPKIEAVLIGMLMKNNYNFWLTMVAVSPKITEQFLGARAWRHTKETEQEFIRATNLALNFYKQTAPNMRVVIWNVWDTTPIYDGKIENSLETYEKYVKIDDFEQKFTENDLREAKIRYLS